MSIEWKCPSCKRVVLLENNNRKQIIFEKETPDMMPPAFRTVLPSVFVRVPGPLWCKNFKMYRICMDCWERIEAGFPAYTPADQEDDGEVD